MAVRSVAEAKGLAAVHSLTALYSYIGGMSQKCRLQLGEPELMLPHLKGYQSKAQ